MGKKAAKGESSRGRAAGKPPATGGITTEGSKEHLAAPEHMSQEQRIDLMRRTQRKLDQQGRPTARPGSGDEDVADRPS
jgi:hypothetical protein